MPTIAAVASAVPPYRLEQATARAYARNLFRDHLPQIERYLTVFDHAAIATRYLSAPVEWFLEPHGLGAANQRFIEMATHLGEEVARACLQQAGLPPAAVDHLIFVSTTGLAAPSIDARLFARLGLQPHTRRTPIWGLGCAGGVGGLARAQEYVRAYPHQRALLVTVELCSLTAQIDDRSKRNLVAMSLFGDGAAAVLVEGDAVARPTRATPQIIDTCSTLFPDSLDLMGWEIVDQGFKVVFGTRIPAVVTEHYHALASTFLARHGLRPADIAHHIYHPGGAKVLAAYARALALPPQALAHSRAILREYGNMSSASVLFVLERFLEDRAVAPGDYGLLCCFGPGFSAELMLIRF